MSPNLSLPACTVASRSRRVPYALVAPHVASRDLRAFVNCSEVEFIGVFPKNYLKESGVPVQAPLSVLALYLPLQDLQCIATHHGIELPQVQGEILDMCRDHQCNRVCDQTPCMFVPVYEDNLHESTSGSRGECMDATKYNLPSDCEKSRVGREKSLNTIRPKRRGHARRTTKYKYEQLSLHALSEEHSDLPDDTVLNFLRQQDIGKSLASDEVAFKTPLSLLAEVLPIRSLCVLARYHGLGRGGIEREMLLEMCNVHVCGVECVNLVTVFRKPTGIPNSYTK